MEFKQASKPISHVSHSNVGVLVIHGITSVPGSMEYVCRRYIEQGYNVECPLLPGHGTVWQDMQNVFWWDWVFAMEQALDSLSRRCSKVFVCGLSLGGGIGAYLATYHPELSGLLLYNHLAQVEMTLLARLAPIARLIVRSVPAIGGDLKDSGANEPAYARLSAQGGWQSIVFSRELQKKLSNITVPTIIFKSREDHVVPLESATLTFDNIASKDKELVWLENSYHVVTMDFDKEIMMDRSLAFVKRLVGV